MTATATSAAPIRARASCRRSAVTSPASPRLRAELSARPIAGPSTRPSASRPPPDEHAGTARHLSRGLAACGHCGLRWVHIRNQPRPALRSGPGRTARCRDDPSDPSDPSPGSRALAARTGVARQGACGPLTDETKVAISRDGPGGLLPGSAVHRGRRQRRPTGAPPPLPHPFAVSTAAWLLLAAVVLAVAILLTQHSPSLRLDDRFSTWVLRGLAGMRTRR